MITQIRFSLFIILIFSKLGISQIPIWEIVLVNDQPYTDVVLNALNDDTLYVNAFGSTYPIKVDSIKYIKSKTGKRSYVADGLFIGAVGGGVAGNLISRNSSGNKGFLGELGDA